jgi:glycine/D-amino acid oxidase-like deaminating enzyme/nitrite reductase/ring-hydroxylating ferredoxin subunit
MGLRSLTQSRETPWFEGVAMPDGEVLRGDELADVCIVGAGIAGLTTAYMLTQAGKRVIVVDDGAIGSGMTLYTTAHLSNEIDGLYSELERVHGTAGTKVIAESHTAAIDRIEAIASEQGIDCDFERVDGFLFEPPGESTAVLHRELQAARRAGLRQVERLARSPLAFFDTGPCLRFPRQAQFHPGKYLAGLANAILRGGGRIFTFAHADRIQGGHDARVDVGAHKITAEAAVVATNSPVNDRLAIHTKQAPYMTYAIGIRVRRGSVPRALLWDTADPYHYVRVATIDAASPYDLLIVGGEDHKSGQAPENHLPHERLASWARERFPMFEAVELEWGGQVMEPHDGIAFIGPNPMDASNVFVATGDAGMGLTHGTIAGILLRDLILGRPNRWAKLYDPRRSPLNAPRELLKETANMAAQYLDLVTPGQVDDVAQIPAGGGAIVRRGVKKLAVYRDEQGTVHERSAICPHLGCVVQWNGETNTWDCPCHGSRFDKLGEVINGPANEGLADISGDR